MKARYIYLPVIGQTVCPASMCPLFAKDGSPWTSEKNARCPKHAHDPDRPGSEDCGFWDNGCDGAGGAMNQVEEAREYGGTLQIGPIHQKRHELARPTIFDCPRALQCQWQQQVSPKLCPPRFALSLGVDPRACAY